MIHLTGLRAPRTFGIGEIERFAWVARQRLLPDVAAHMPVPAVTLFERAARIPMLVGGVHRPVHYLVEDDCGKRVEGCARYVESHGAFELVVRSSVYDAIDRGETGRGPFTVAHEVGHLLLHRDLLVQLATIPSHGALLRASGRHQPESDTEAQADAFAASLLMPVPGLVALAERYQLTPESVEQTFRVSRSAAVRRLHEFHEWHEEMLRAVDMW